MSFISKNTGETIDYRITELFNLIYPVGSYYMSSSATNPSSLFGGTWEQIKDKMIMAAGDNYKVNTTGGSNSHTHSTKGHTLTIEEMPKHNHGFSLPVSGYSGWKLITTNEYTVAFDFTNNKTYFGPGEKIHKANAGTNGTNTFLNGSSQSHNHGDTTGASSLPPYIVAYIWRRVA